MPQQRIGFLQHWKVNRVGVRKQQQPAPPADACQQTFGDQRIGQEDGAPDFAELIVADVQIEHAGELIDEIVGLDQARFEPVDQIGCADALRDLGGRNAAYLLEAPVAACEIKRNDDFSQIEDD